MNCHRLRIRAALQQKHTRAHTHTHVNPCTHVIHTHMSFIKTVFHNFVTIDSSRLHVPFQAAIFSHRKQFYRLYLFNVHGPAIRCSWPLSKTKSGFKYVVPLPFMSGGECDALQPQLCSTQSFPSAGSFIFIYIRLLCAGRVHSWWPACALMDLVSEFSLRRKSTKKFQMFL